MNRRDIKNIYRGKTYKRYNKKDKKNRKLTEKRYTEEKHIRDIFVKNI